MLAPALCGASVVDLIDINGNDSGWSAILVDDGYTGIIMGEVTGSCVRIHITKNFYGLPVGGIFSTNVIQFHQRLDDGLTVSSIVIEDESIANLTGAEWTDYHWHIDGDAAAFDKTGTAGLSINPFTIMTWGPAQTGGWDANHPASIDAFGGVVPIWTAYWPGLGAGRFVIEVNLVPADSDFLLVQYPTPEPGTMALLALGACALLGRARRNKPDRGGRSRA